MVLSPESLTEAVFLVIGLVVATSFTALEAVPTDLRRPLSTLGKEFARGLFGSSLALLPAVTFVDSLPADEVGPLPVSLLWKPESRELIPG